jgi:hypothetical protein
MNIFKSFRRWALGLAVAGLLSPTLAGAAQPAVTQSQPNAARPQRIADVALHQGGVFAGQVVNAQGVPRGNAKVVMTQKAKVVAIARTDKQGRFVVRGVRAGVYQVQAEQTVSVLRLWAERTAPPAARPAALLVSDSTIALGQDDGGTNLRTAAIIFGAGAAGGGAWYALDYNKPGS